VCRSLSRDIYGGRNRSAKSSKQQPNMYLIVSCGNERDEEIGCLVHGWIGERSDLIEIDWLLNETHTARRNQLQQIDKRSHLLNSLGPITNRTRASTARIYASVWYDSSVTTSVTILNTLNKRHWVGIRNCAKISSMYLLPNWKFKSVKRREILPWTFARAQIILFFESATVSSRGLR